MGALPLGAMSALVGLACGLALGLSARLGDFCTLGALESAVWGGDQRRIRLWGIVLGTAIAVSFIAEALGQADLTQSFYHSIAFNPVAAILGGLCFGYGMALAGNCGFGALVRFGGGDLRALVVVVVMGIFAFITLSGPLAPLREAIFPQPAADTPQGFAHALAAHSGLSPLVFALPVTAAFLALGLSHRPLRDNGNQLSWGVVAGIAVAFGFIGTSWLNHESFGLVQVEAASFTAPMGRTILYLMTSTAGGITFSVGLVLGVLAGAFIGSVRRGLFRWEACEDPRELGRQVLGAALMGIGGTIAMGCSIGQGVSGMAVLAWSAPLALTAIAAGGVIGLHRLIAGAEPD